MAYVNRRYVRPSSVPTGRNMSSSSRSVGSHSQSRGVTPALSMSKSSPSWSAPRASGGVSDHEQERNSKKRPSLPPWMQQTSLLRPTCKVKRISVDVNTRVQDGSTRKGIAGGALGQNSKGVGEHETCQLWKIAVAPDKRTLRAVRCEVRTAFSPIRSYVRSVSHMGINASEMARRKHGLFRLVRAVGLRTYSRKTASCLSTWQPCFWNRTFVPHPLSRG